MTLEVGADELYHVNCMLVHVESSNAGGLICKPCTVGSRKNEISTDNCTLCDAGVPNTETVGTVNALQCFADDGEDWFEDPALLVPITLGPVIVAGGGFSLWVYAPTLLGALGRDEEGDPATAAGSAL